MVAILFLILYAMTQIPHYPDYLLCSKTHQVFSKKTQRFLKPGKTKRGDFLFQLYSYNTKTFRTEYLHRVIYLCANPSTPWETFLANQVDHIDGDHTNNHPKNLRLITQQENLAHFWKEFFPKFGRKRWNEKIAICDWT